MGWRVMTIWECQLKPAVRQQTLLEMEYFINHTYLERFKPKHIHFAYQAEEEMPVMAAENSATYHTAQAAEDSKKDGQTFSDVTDNA